MRVAVTALVITALALAGVAYAATTTRTVHEHVCDGCGVTVAQETPGMPAGWARVAGPIQDTQKTVYCGDGDIYGGWTCRHSHVVNCIHADVWHFCVACRYSAAAQLELGRKLLEYEPEIQHDPLLPLLRYDADTGVVTIDAAALAGVGVEIYGGDDELEWPFSDADIFELTPDEIRSLLLGQQDLEEAVPADE